MARHLCPCGNEIRFLGDFDTDYHVAPKAVLDRIGANPGQGRDAAEAFLDAKSESEVFMLLCTDCGRFALDTGPYISAHAVETEIPRKRVFLLPDGSEQKYSDPPLGRWEKSEYHCLCGNSFLTGGEHKEHCYVFMPDVVVEVVTNAITDDGLSGERFYAIMNAYGMAVVACPVCGRMGVDRGGTVQFYKYEGKLKNLDWRGWNEPGFTPGSFEFPESDPPDNPWDSKK